MSVFLGVVMLLAFLIAVFVIFRGVSPTIVIIVFGAWFGQVLVQTGIAESMIRTAVELAGDRPIAVAWAVSLITALLFTSIYGVGAAISIGVIAIPIMLSLGIPPKVAAPAFTMAIGAGNYLNPVEFGIFKNFFKGIEYGPPYFTFYLIGFAVYLACALAMSAWNLRGVQVRRASAVGVAATQRVRVPWISYLAPAIPVVVIIAFKWPLIPAFLLAIVFALVTTQGSRSLRDSVAVFHKAFYDAFPDIATIAALWIICGMLIVAGQLDAVKAVLNPVFSPFIPHGPFGAAVFFALLAPLAIYRGPFSVVGTGAALLAVMLNANYVSPIFLYLVDHRLYQDLPRRVPQDRPAVGLADGRDQRVHRLLHVRLDVRQLGVGDRWDGSSASASTWAGPSPRRCCSTTTATRSSARWLSRPRTGPRRAWPRG